MYIRKSSQTYNGKTYFNYVLVESVLTPKGPRQKIICSLGDLRPRPRAEWLELAHKLSSALCGNPDLLAGLAPDRELEQLVAKVNSASAPPRSGQLPQLAAAESNLVAVHIDQVRTEESREAGPVHVGYQFWLRLGVDGILGKPGLCERTLHLPFAMALNRFILPGMDLAIQDGVRSLALSDILAV